MIAHDYLMFVKVDSLPAQSLIYLKLTRTKEDRQPKTSDMKNTEWGAGNGT